MLQRSEAEPRCFPTQGSCQSLLNIPQGQSGTRALLFRLLFPNNTDNALLFHICTFIQQVPHKPVRNEYEHAAHSYDISDTPNHGTKPSSYKAAARNCAVGVREVTSSCIGDKCLKKHSLLLHLLISCSVPCYSYDF